jgi:hypothetical protein
MNLHQNQPLENQRQMVGDHNVVSGLDILNKLKR